MDIGDFLGRDALGDELVSYVVIDVGTGRDWRREMAEDKLGRPPGLRGAKGDGFKRKVTMKNVATAGTPGFIALTGVLRLLWKHPA